jgi:hypothetical protein
LSVSEPDAAGGEQIRRGREAAAREVGVEGVATREPRDFTRAEIDAILEMGSVLARALRAR